MIRNVLSKLFPIEITLDSCWRLTDISLINYRINVICTYQTHSAHSIATMHYEI